jgi:UDP-3-O-[3-hydroxymyristoyl] glucosamine N-acyltransferase
METDKNFYTSQNLSLLCISKHIGATIYQNGEKISISEDIKIKSIGDISTGTEEQIGFIESKKYLKSLADTNLLACITSISALEYAPKGLILLVVENPGVQYAKASALLYPTPSPSKPQSTNYYISPTAALGKGSEVDFGCYIGENAIIGDNVKIHPNTYIGDNVKIGNNCIIYSNVTIQCSIIGNNAIIHPGARIGQDGFGYKTEHGKHIKVPQIGNVVIGNNVEIGSNTCVDRGSITSTIIKDECKLDNMVQIGHNVELGKGCIIISQVGIAGSSKIGDYVIVAAKAGIAGHLKIADYVQIGAKSGITTNISEKGQVVLGFPAKPARQFWKQEALIRKMLNNKLKND